MCCSHEPAVPAGRGWFGLRHRPCRPGVQEAGAPRLRTSDNAGREEDFSRAQPKAPEETPQCRSLGGEALGELAGREVTEKHAGLQPSAALEQGPREPFAVTAVGSRTEKFLQQKGTPPRGGFSVPCKATRGSEVSCLSPSRL